MSAPDDLPFTQRHTIIGLAIVSIIFAQVLMGFATNILKQISWSSPLAIYSLNKAHKYTGYALVILAKIQVYLILNLDPDTNQLFWALLGTEIVLFVAFILRKITFSTLN